MGSAIPCHNIIVLKLPKLMRSWVGWGDYDEKMMLHTIKWSEVCRIITQGELEISESKVNNIALLTKTC